ncbi:hypothetical protein [Streptomyces sp. ICC4]|nr:hypothetical protein [Streptomyces sp. ICC4]
MVVQDDAYSLHKDLAQGETWSRETRRYHPHHDPSPGDSAQTPAEAQA